MGKRKQLDAGTRGEIKRQALGPWEYFICSRKPFAIMPFSYNHPSQPPGQKAGKLLNLPLMSPKRLDYLQGCIYLYILYRSVFFHQPHSYKSTFVCDERRNGTAFFYSSSSIILNQSKHTFDHLEKRMQNKTSLELYHCYKFETYLTVDRHALV